MLGCCGLRGVAIVKVDARHQATALTTAFLLLLRFERSVQVLFKIINIRDH